MKEISSLWITPALFLFIISIQTLPQTAHNLSILKTMGILQLTSLEARLSASIPNIIANEKGMEINSAYTL